MKPIHRQAVIERVRYDTRKAQLIAGDDFWDGNNWERSGRNTFLYKTKSARYFVVHQTCWEREQDSLEPLSQDEAISLFESLPEQRVEFEDAFPGVSVEEA